MPTDSPEPHPANPELLLGIIPARGGSKGIPGKNIKPLAGKPLLAYTVEAAQKAGIFSRLILSTDNQAVAQVGRKFGAEVLFLRPPELAEDSTPMLPVLQHAVAALERDGWRPDMVAILQPTAPFRRPEELVQGYELLRTNPNADSVVSVAAVPEHFSPHFVMKIEGGRLLPFMPDGLSITRRQDAPQAWTRSGDFYFTRRRVLIEGDSIYGQNCLPFVITRPQRVNLDTIDDWVQAELIAARHRTDFKRSLE